jgi:hypothetical protein
MTDESDLSKAAALLGSKGGRAGGHKGGKARMASLTPEERRTLARKAIRMRWAKRRKGK